MDNPHEPQTVQHAHLIFAREGARDKRDIIKMMKTSRKVTPLT